MRKLPFQRVLALSAHTDDIEFGCGATIHRLIQQGAEIFSVVFSICEESVPQELEKDILLTEMYQSAKILGIKDDNIYVHKYAVRKFPQYRQDILEILINLKKKINPDLVLTHCRSDIHQDHQVVSQESIRAFRHTSMLGYELPWNNIEFNCTGLIEVQPENIAVKSAAIGCYKSQGFRHYNNREFFENHARLRGLQNKTALAEAFETIRLTL